jgi:hypothetical protein
MATAFVASGLAVSFSPFRSCHPHPFGVEPRWRDVSRVLEAGLVSDPSRRRLALGGLLARRVGREFVFERGWLDVRRAHLDRFDA